MIQRFLVILYLVGGALCCRAQHTKALIGKTYDRINTVKGFEHYKPIKAYNVFDEMTCIRYQDSITFQEFMVFQRDKEVDGQVQHLVADVLKIEGTGRYRLLSVGYNRFSPYSEKNIVICIEAIPEDGRYVLDERSSKIYSAYTLEHKGHKFVPVDLGGLYRIGEDYYRERSTRY